ncbi:MAG: MFS transporter [Phycisphaeraceae bacterium]|nr:MFS transporter [Phycisphaeraceae bacterium]
MTVRRHDRVPAYVRTRYARERPAWLLLSILGAAVEGGVVGVIVKNGFSGTVPPLVLNAAVAIAAGAPAFANITSFLWSGVARGRSRVRLLVAIQLLAALCALLMGLMPQTAWGLLGVLAGALAGRICWTGVVTLRAAVWQANYPRAVRATVTGRLATVQAIFMAATAFAFGEALDRDVRSFHWLFALAGASGLIGALAYGRVRVRGQWRALRREDAGETGSGRPFEGLRAAWRVLREDALYRRYMLIMFVFGIGNLAAQPILVILLADLFGYSYRLGIQATTVIPIGLMPLTVPLWSRLLDRMHVVEFRRLHAWSFVAANTALLAAILLRSEVLLWSGLVLRGAALAGGVLGWNLGHQDFGDARRTSDYMAVHVTLTGVRGAIGPVLAVLLYELASDDPRVGGAIVFGTVIALNVAGAVAFLAMSRAMRGRRGVI